jgi:pimeloyl-ACP methyl ester carboxylesterase
VARLATTRGGSGEPMLLIHGLGSSRTVWDSTRPPLERHFDVIAVDMPGFGDQPWFEDGSAPTMDSLANAVEAEMDELGVDRAHIVGNSMGGWIAIELARRERATDVVAISPVGGATPGEARQSGVVLRVSRAMSRASRPTCAFTMRSATVRRLGFSGVATGDVPYEDAINAIGYMARSQGFPKLLRNVAGEGDLIEANRERFGQVGCPVLIAWGAEDRVLSPAGGPRMAEAIPGSELRVLDGCGHTPMLDRPAETAAMILGARGISP